MNFEELNNDLFINLGVIAALTVVGILIARTLIFKALLSFASHSDTEHDDTLIKTLKISFLTNVSLEEINFIC